MNLLAMDTSGPVAGVSIIKDDQVVYEAMAVNKFTHSVSMMPMVEEALTHAGMNLEEMDALAVTVGPGSFTGVRIGVSTVKGMAHGAGKPCIPVDALEAMAFSAPFFEGVICPIQDARAGQVYGAAFAWKNGEFMRLMPDSAMKLEDYMDHLLTLGERFWFTGDGLNRYRDVIRQKLGDQAIIAPAALSYLRPGCAAALALEKREEQVDYLTLAPMYLRAPQAQREREAREARNG